MGNKDSQWIINIGLNHTRFKQSLAFFPLLNSFDLEKAGPKWGQRTGTNPE